jgi:UDP-glucuronate 4-epimerase
MKIIITGVAGFIGFHTAKALLNINNTLIIGLDNLNDYYDQNLKKGRLSLLSHPRFKFYKSDISNKSELYKIFEDNQPDYVIHLAAQAGVRYSIVDPHSYINANVIGFLNILESCRLVKIKHLVYASSSSVYGLNDAAVFSENDNVDKPTSIYASSKKSNEGMSHAYSHLYNLPTTGLRFFTVYGPWGRPDMAYYKFVKNIISENSIDVYGLGKMQRDFTFIDDVVWAIKKVVINPPQLQEDLVPWQIFNVGNNKPIELENFIDIIETKLNKKAVKNYTPMMPGDVISTAASIDKLNKYCGYKPTTTIEEGLTKFISWYKDYHL